MVACLEPNKNGLLYVWLRFLLNVFAFSRGKSW